MKLLSKERKIEKSGIRPAERLAQSIVACVLNNGKQALSDVLRPFSPFVEQNVDQHRQFRTVEHRPIENPCSPFNKVAKTKLDPAGNQKMDENLPGRDARALTLRAVRIFSIRPMGDG